jgi:hypothetical protein
MTGRVVDSYTNIHTLKTFSSSGHEDDYVAASVLDHAQHFRRLPLGLIQLIPELAYHRRQRHQIYHRSRIYL